MTDYRLYVFGRRRQDGARGRIQRVIPIECEDDVQACALGEQRRDGQYMELWNRGRLVKTFEP